MQSGVNESYSCMPWADPDERKRRQRELQRERYARLKNDPEWMERRRADQKAAQTENSRRKRLRDRLSNEQDNLAALTRTGDEYEE